VKKEICIFSGYVGFLNIIACTSGNKFYRRRFLLSIGEGSQEILVKIYLAARCMM